MRQMGCSKTVATMAERLFRSYDFSMTPCALAASE